MIFVKSQLLGALVQPVILNIEKIMRRHNQPGRISADDFDVPKKQMEDMGDLLGLIREKRDELSLLFFKAHGSAYEGFREELVERMVEMGEGYLDALPAAQPGPEIRVSRFFLHQMGSFHVNMIAELVMHPLSDGEEARFTEEYVTFVAAGWKRLLAL